MLAVVDFDGCLWSVRDGEHDERRVYCRCEHQLDAEMIAAALNGVARLTTAQGLVAKRKVHQEHPNRR